MGRFQVHFGAYMASYGVLMFVSFLLWQAACGAAGAEALLGLSDFLIGFAAIAYPLFICIARIVQHIVRHFGGRRGSMTSDAGSLTGSSSPTPASTL